MTCIEGRGFEKGGFAIILIDNKEVPKSIIAAAPALLAALVDLVSSFTHPAAPEEPQAVTKARAAIAQANGETP